MNYKYLLLLVLPLFLLTSCEETVDQEVNIYLLNQTSSKLAILLTPTDTYDGTLGYYRFSSNSNGYRSSSFQIDTGTTHLLFSNAKFSESASQVSRKVFKNIAITLQDGKNTRIFFSPDSASNYESNIFLDNAVWIFEKNMQTRPTQLKKNLVECHDYYFVIDEKSLVNKK